MRCLRPGKILQGAALAPRVTQAGSLRCTCGSARTALSTRVQHSVCDAERALSGAGAGAQLKILACNISGGCLVGDILVNGSPVSPKEFRKQSAVVWQSDVLLATATVRLCAGGLHHALACTSATPRNWHLRRRCVEPLRQH